MRLLILLFTAILLTSCDEQMTRIKRVDNGVIIVQNMDIHYKVGDTVTLDNYYSIKGVIVEKFPK